MTDTKTPARGRPKSRTKQKQIFTAAVELFLERGFDGTSMDEVAERAGVSKQTVYSHFNSKEELFSHCVSEKCSSHEMSAEFMDVDRPVADMLADIAERFSAMVHSAEAIGVKRILSASAEQQPHLSQLFYDAGPRRTIDLLADYLRIQSDRGQLAVKNPRIAAAQLLHMLQGETVSCAILNTPCAPEMPAIAEYNRSCVEVFMKAYGV